MMTQFDIGRQKINERRLEKLFGSKFSQLNIEDEYEYNLSYLLQSSPRNQNIYVPYPTSLSPSALNHFAYGFSAMNFGVHRSRSALLLDDETPEKQSPVRQFHTVSHVSRSKTPNFALPQKNAYSPPTWCRPTSSGINEKKAFLYSRSRTTPYSTDNKLLTSPRITLTTPDSTDLNHPNLPLYLTESEKPFYATCPVDAAALNSKGAIACDPILIMHPVRSRNAPNSQQVSLSGQQKNGYVDSNYSDYKQPKVSSRVEALIALISQNRKLGEQESHEPANYTHDNEELVSNSHPQEWAIKAPRIRLQRSSTFTNGHTRGTNRVQSTEYCFSCCKRIYPMDRMSIGDRVYHKSCFKCAICQRTVLPGTFACLDGVILCKPHYIEQFRRSGRYELRASFRSKYQSINQVRGDDMENSEDIIEISEE